MGITPDAICVDWQTLIEAMYNNLNHYWQDWASNPDKYQVLIFDNAIEWVVLGILRQYYSFKESSITSKIGAGEYSLKHLAKEWHRLIKDALHIRQKQSSIYHDKLLRQELAKEFLQFIIAECNIIFNLQFKRI